MFKLKYEGTDREDYQPFGSGVVFGTIGKPVKFTIIPDPGAGPPLPVEIVVANEALRKPFEFALDMSAGTMRILFYNPAPLPSVSGLTQPTPFLLLAGQGPRRALVVMFTVDFLTTAAIYRLTYEFAVGTVPEPQGAKP